MDERETHKKSTKKDKKEQGGTEAIVKAWELNVFVAHLSWFSPVNE